MSEEDREFDRRLLRAKLDALKELAYGASHEINNPLANISARAQSLLRDEADPERRRTLEAIYQQALRAHEMISDLMLFARPPQLVLAPVDLAPLLEELVGELREECRRRGIALKVHAAVSLPSVTADASALAAAIRSLLVNAMEAIGRDGRIEVAVSASKSHIEIAVHDSGPGIPAEIAEKIFDPFFSGREAGRGLGFGLSKCWRVVTDHGGEVTAANRPTGGATFTITLPLTARRQEGEALPSPT